ncbi:CbiM family transporter [Natroniella sulfidigena]|uniref:CbiM family transporter n=1 Tax=Natroniella sulfidigena TaxID=723921 RepID=UPI00200ADC3F|nr:CbiM family transporter [Natroniella sulfidigena]MCK8817393.1 CbiM family transporter [Natroniella sulfidigena]
MHLPDGVVREGVLLASYGGSALLYYLSSRQKKADFKLVPKMSLVTAVLFVASLIHIPVGMTTVHFSFVGLAGILLGPLSFLSVLVALFLQLILFNHGGYSTLGVNTLNFAMGALSGYYIFRLRKNLEMNNFLEGVFAFLAGAGSMLVKVAVASVGLYLSDYPASVAISLTTVHLPIFLGEGVVTALLVVALSKKNRGYIYDEE